jgi:hypothetical protein
MSSLESFREHCRSGGHQVLRYALSLTESSKTPADALRLVDALIARRDAHHTFAPRRLPTGAGIDDLTDKLREARELLV